MSPQIPELSLNPAEETIRVGPLTLRFLVTAENSNGSIAAFEMSVPAGKALPAPPHFHERYEETIYGIDGVLTWTVDGKAIDVGTGQMLCIPRGAVHRFDNNGAEDARVLCVLTPAAIGPEYFRETSAILEEARGGPPDRAKIFEVMRRYGLTPVLPN